MGEMVKQIASLQDYESYQDLHWEGSFEDYLKLVEEKDVKINEKLKEALLKAAGK